MPATFAQRAVASGIRAIQPIAVAMQVGASPLVLGVRVIRPDEDLEALAYANGVAKAKNATAQAEDPVYSLALMVARVRRASVALTDEAAALAATGVLKPYVSDDAPVPFFASEEEILGADDLCRDRIAYIAEQQEVWQEQVSPLKTKLSPVAVLEQAKLIAEAIDPGPFLGLRPGMRWIFARATAAMLLSSLQIRSQSGTGTTSTERPSTTGSEAASSSDTSTKRRRGK